MSSLPSANEVCEGYVFTPVCHSVHGGGLPQCMLGYHPPPPREQTPTPWEQTPPPLGADTPPLGADTPPGDGYCCGRYASYRNAFLLGDL